MKLRARQKQNKTKQSKKKQRIEDEGSRFKCSVTVQIM
jgi:hypothetical protein